MGDGWQAGGFFGRSTEEWQVPLPRLAVSSVPVVLALPCPCKLQTAGLPACPQLTHPCFCLPPLLPVLSYPHVVNPLAAERLYLSSDVGRPREVLQAEFQGYCFRQLPASSSESDSSGNASSSSNGYGISTSGGSSGVSSSGLCSSSSDGDGDGAWWYTGEGAEQGDEELHGEHYIDLIEAREPPGKAGQAGDAGWLAQAWLRGG